MTTRGVDPPDGVPKPQVSPASPPTRDERWSALRIELQEANEERDKLAAENARLREGLFELAGGRSGIKSLLERFWNISAWWLETAPQQERIVPAHIVALQEATYR